MKYVLSAVLVLVLGVLVDACPPPTASAPVVVMAPRAAAVPMVCPEVPPTASAVMVVPSAASTPVYTTTPTFAATPTTTFATAPMTLVYPSAAPARAVYPARLARPFVPRVRAGVRVGW